MANELNKLSQAVEQSTNIVVISDLEGNIEYVNRRYETATGFPKDTLLGKKMWRQPIIHFPADIIRTIIKHLTSGTEWDGEVKVKRTDKSILWAKISVSPIIDKRGSPAYYLSIITDITENKERENTITLLNKRLKKAFNTIKEEFEEHLSSINENTNEIQANYEYLCNIDSKIDKLNEKIEGIQLFIKHFTNEKTIDDSKKQDYNHIFLTTREKEVFLALYTLAEEKGPITYKAIARRIGLTEFMVREYIINLIEKGIPVVKRYVNQEVYLDIDQKFRHMQAKENLVDINESMTRKFIN